MQAGDGVAVTGAGSVLSPYIITAQAAAADGTVAQISVGASADDSLTLEPGPDAVDTAPVTHNPSPFFGDAFVEMSVALGPIDLPAGGLFTLFGYTNDPLLLFCYWKVIVSNAAGTERLFGASGWEAITPVGDFGVFHAPDTAEWVNVTNVGSDLSFEDEGIIQSTAGGLYWIDLWVRAAQTNFSP